MKFALVLLFAITSLNSFAHIARADKQGCHNDKKGGTRHCHKFDQNHKMLKDFTLVQMIKFKML